MASVDSPAETKLLPTHLDLPDSDGENVINGFERPQTALLLDPLRPHLLEALHPDGNFFLGGDIGFYWRITDPPLDGCKCPDISYVPGVPPMLDGTYRRSYVMWQEHVPPTLLIELVSDADGSEERDATPNTGKFWVYEQGIRARYYAIYDPDREHLEMFELVGGRFRPMNRNPGGRFPLPLIGLELGFWEGEFQQVRCSFLRFFTPSGFMLPTPGELAALESNRADEAEKQIRQEKKKTRAEAKRAEQEKQRADAERLRAEQEKKAADLLREKLRQLGVDPDSP